MTDVSAATAPLRGAGFWRRVAAYFIDILPFLALFGGVAWAFFGLDEAWRNYLDRPGDTEARATFLVERNLVRNAALGAYLVYSGVMDASPLQGTLGKRALGMRVVGPEGERLSIAMSARRNGTKVLSFIPCGLGVLWIVFSKRKRAWHDLIAGTHVVVERP